MKSFNRIIVFLYCCLCVSCILFSQEGNYRFENYGNRSILLNGNVTGSVNDFGLTYYNPARLAIVEKTAFTINAKAYQLINITLKDGFGGNQKLKNSNFDGIPSMVAGTFELDFVKKGKFAYSFISKTRFNVRLNFNSGIKKEDLIGEYEGEETYFGSVNLNNKVSDEWFGVTWATKISDNFSFGISSFFSIYDFQGGNKTSFTILGLDNKVAQYNNYISIRQKSYGMFTKLGVSWTLHQVELGLNISLPYLELKQSGSVVYEKFLSGFVLEEDAFIFNRFKKIEAKRKRPFGIAIGAGIPLGKSTIHTNIEWFHKVSLYDRVKIPKLTSQTVTELPQLQFKEELNHVINFGVGAEIYMSPVFKGYISFSTDFSAFNKNANLFDLINTEGNDINISSNYFHVGFGGDMKFKWASIILGGIYSSGGDSEFNKSIDLPFEIIDNVNNNQSELIIRRWRFIVGVNIPFLKK